MKNIHILPTDKPILDGSINYILKCIKEFKIYNKQYKIGDILDELSWDFDSNYWEPQNIYITNDEKPKAGEWSLYQNKIHKCIEDIVGDEFKKIILTTDQELIKDGVQSIPDEFLEWFIKNPSCDEVEVADLWKEGNPSTHDSYQIIIPKEEPKQETLEDVRKVERTELFNYIYSVVKKIPRKDVDGDAMDAPNCAYELEQLFYKWQQERMYSEEDMIEFSKWRVIYEDANPSNVKHSKKLLQMWFEQFKKK